MTWTPMPPSSRRDTTGGFLLLEALITVALSALVLGALLASRWVAILAEADAACAKPDSLLCSAKKNPVGEEPAAPAAPQPPPGGPRP